MSETLSQEDVKELAKIAQINLLAEELTLLTKKLNDTIKSTNILESIPTNGVKPLINPLTGTIALRDDLVESSLDRDCALQNATKKYDGYFQVPRTIEG